MTQRADFHLLPAAVRGLTRAEATIFGLAFSVLAVWVVMSIETVHGAAGARVLGSFWTAGHLANLGANPYADGPFIPRVGSGATTVLDRNLNPPAWLPVCQILALFPLPALARAWVVGSAVLFSIGAVWIVKRSPAKVPVWRIAAMLLSVATLDTIFLVQMYAVIFLLAAAGWLALKARKDIAAGVAIGALVALKPNFGLWPLYLLIAGRTSVSAYAALTVAVMSLLPVLLYGQGVYVEWVQAICADDHWVMGANVSLPAIARRLDIGPIGSMAACGIVLAGAAWVRLCKPCSERISVVALAIAILAAPLGWGYYVLVLFPALLGGFWGPLGWLAALIELLPIRFAPAGLLAPFWGQATITALQLTPILLIIAGNIMTPQLKRYLQDMRFPLKSKDLVQIMVARQS
jgi:hypothetical protein